jgi:cell division cycle 14
MKSTQKPAVASSTTTKSGVVVGTENQPIEIIPGRLFWISDKTPPKSRQHAFYFCIDNDLVYEPFFADFGPLDLGKVHLFCKELEKLMSDS